MAMNHIRCDISYILVIVKIPYYFPLIQLLYYDYLNVPFNVMLIWLEYDTYIHQFETGRLHSTKDTHPKFNSASVTYSILFIILVKRVPPAYGWETAKCKSWEWAFWHPLLQTVSVKWHYSSLHMRQPTLFISMNKIFLIQIWWCTLKTTL
jgi:hypothetical protein